MGPKKNKQDEEKNKNLKKCAHFDRGFCKHRQKCNDFHPDKDKVCSETNCPNTECDSKHPNPCKFGGRCTFFKNKECLYSHVTFVDDERNRRIAELERKFKSFESQRKKETDAFEKEVSKKLEDFANNIRSLENYVENVKNSIKKPNHLEKEVNEKIELFENRIELLRKAIEEKDMKINILEKQIEKIVKSREKPNF